MSGLLPSSAGSMRVQVDLTRCLGYAQCCFAAPRVFRMTGTEALEFDANPAPGEHDDVRRAAAACPVQAIRLGSAVDARPREAGNGRSVVIVGGSLAGLRAAEAVRLADPSASITVIEAEAHPPYDRPPLSKGVLLGQLGPDDIGLTALAQPSADWRLGRRAVSLDRGSRVVVLEDGSRVSYDRLLIATGSHARPWPVPDEAELDGVLTVRGVEDATRLREALRSRPARVVVIGAGFIGSELASACRALDLPVTVLERGAAPLGRALGRTVGELMARLQRDHGVDLRLGVEVDAIEGDDRRQVRAVRLKGGERIETALVVVALGAVRNTAWLEGAGLRVDRDGVATDLHCRALNVDGSSTDDIFVAGDVAKWPSALFGDDLGVEHWSNATAGAQIAGRNLARRDGALDEYRYLPTFWSSQFGVNIKSAGVSARGEDFAVVQGSLESGRFAGVYGKAGRIVGAVTVDHGRHIDFYARLIEACAPFPPNFSVARGPSPAV